MPRPRLLASLSLVAVLVPAGAPHAQDTTGAVVVRRGAIDGRITGEGGQAVAYATIFAAGGALLARADEGGIFHLAGFPAGVQQFGVRRIGYAPIDFEIEMPADSTVTVLVRMKQVVQRLSEITVEEKRIKMSLWRVGFYDRQSRSVGTFILPAEIDARHPQQLGDMLYGINSVTMNNGGMQSGQFALGIEAGGPCRLHVWLDGKPLRLGNGGLSEVPISGIRAIEVYPRASSTPLEFQGIEYRCGAIVLWTKVD